MVSPQKKMRSGHRDSGRELTALGKSFINPVVTPWYCISIQEVFSFLYALTALKFEEK